MRVKFKMKMKTLFSFYAFLNDFQAFSEASYCNWMYFPYRNKCFLPVKWDFFIQFKCNSTQKSSFLNFRYFSLLYLFPWDGSRDRKIKFPRTSVHTFPVICDVTKQIKQKIAHLRLSRNHANFYEVLNKFKAVNSYLCCLKFLFE